MNKLYDILPIVGQNAACTVAGIYRAYTRYSPKFHSRLAELERSIDAPLEELHQLQWTRLEKLVSRARKYVPHYHDLPPPSSASEAEDAIRNTLEQIPFLTKETYRENAESFVAKDIRKRDILRGKTSGTTGTALPLYFSVRTLAEEYATVWRLRGFHGVGINDRHLTFNGQLIVPVKQVKPPYWRNNMYQRQILFSIYHMTTRNRDDYVNAIHNMEALYIDGYPSALYQAAQAMLELDRKLPKNKLKAVFTSSESLLAYQREIIELAFGAPVWDRYGTAEFAVSMTACSAKNLHVDMEYGIVEVEVREETDDYVRGPLVVTGLANDVTPFLRYRIGDSGTRLKRACPCGRAGDAFLDIDGRSDDFVITPEGRKIGRLDHIFKDQTGVIEAQIRQNTTESIDVLFVAGRRFGSKDEKGLVHEIRSRLGDDIKIRLLPVEAIPREANGKFRAVKSSVT
jgi:phenylacetate-CoA ligase